MNYLTLKCILKQEEYKNGMFVCSTKIINIIWKYCLFFLNYETWALLFSGDWDLCHWEKQRYQIRKSNIVCDNHKREIKIFSEIRKANYQTQTIYEVCLQNHRFCCCWYLWITDRMGIFPSSLSFIFLNITA